MEVTTADEARAWLASWGDKMRPGILKAAIDGQRLRLAIAKGNPRRYGPEVVAADEAVIAVLEGAR